MVETIKESKDMQSFLVKELNNIALKKFSKISETIGWEKEIHTNPARPNNSDSEWDAVLDQNNQTVHLIVPKEKAKQTMKAFENKDINPQYIWFVNAYPKKVDIYTFETRLFVKRTKSGNLNIEQHVKLDTCIELYNINSYGQFERCFYGYKEKRKLVYYGPSDIDRFYNSVNYESTNPTVIWDQNNFDHFCHYEPSLFSDIQLNHMTSIITKENITKLLLVFADSPCVAEKVRNTEINILKKVISLPIELIKKIL